MTMTRQYIGVRFGGPGSKIYTYHNDGPALAIGDEVEVRVGKPNRMGYRAKSRLKIVSLSDDKPQYFQTKQVGIPIDPGVDLIDDGDAR